MAVFLGLGSLGAGLSYSGLLLTETIIVRCSTLCQDHFADGVPFSTTEQLKMLRNNKIATRTNVNQNAEAVIIQPLSRG